MGEEEAEGEEGMAMDKLEDLEGKFEKSASSTTVILIGSTGSWNANGRSLIGAVGERTQSSDSVTSRNSIDLSQSSASSGTPSSVLNV